MTEHHLTNPRVVRPPHSIPEDTPEPVCAQCATPLHLVPLEGIRTGTRTWCSDRCYDAFITDRATQKVHDYVAADQRRRSVAATARAVAAGEPQTYVAPKPKSGVRQTAEVGANIVGFIIWLVIISAIAAAIYHFTGIDSTR